jgi:hypothetical protein
MLVIYLAYIVPGTVLVPMLSFGIRHRRASAAAKIIFLYLVISSLLNLGGILLALNHRSNLWLLHLYTIAEMLILLRFFYLIIRSVTVRRVIRILAVVFPLGCLVNLLVFQPASAFNTYPRSIEALVFIGLSLVFWLDGHEEGSDSPWIDDPMNWMVSGLILYFASDFLLFLCSNFLLARELSGGTHRVWQLAWMIHGTMVLLMYILFSIGFLK